MHAAGQHSTRTNEIQLSSMSVAITQELSGNITRIFDMGTPVKVIDVKTRPEDGLYHVYVTYLELVEGNYVGKVLFANMQTLSGFKTYSFTN